MASEEEDRQLLTVDQWNEWWKKQYESGSHHDHEHGGVSADDIEELSVMLKKHKTVFFTEGACRRIFVPLCGSSPDLKWLADQGQEVIGIECSEHAILKLFESSDIEYEKSVSPVDKSFNVFTAKNAKIVFYQGDFFKFGPEIAGGQIDGIWDTASLNTIPLDTRKAYVQVMFSLMKKDARYLLSAMYFGDKKTWKDNPFDITEVDMKDLFGSCCTWEMIDKDDSEWGLEQVYLIKFSPK